MNCISYVLCLTNTCKSLSLHILTATNIQEHVYIEAECPKVGVWYICEQKLSHQIRNQQDCVQKLIQSQEVDGTCKPTPISLYKEALVELDDSHYAVTFPKPTKVQLKCHQDQHVILEGSYVVTIPHQCYLKTSEFTLVNINNKLRGQPLRIMSVPLPSEAHEHTPVIKMNSINLSHLNSVERQIALEYPVEIDHVQTTSIYHTTIPMYVLALFSAGALCIMYYHRRRLAPTTNDKQTIELAAMERRAATFALDVGK